MMKQRSSNQLFDNPGKTTGTGIAAGLTIRYIAIAALMVVLTLVAGCGQAEPTPTIVPPTATTVPTSTSLPPTAIPLPEPSPTLVEQKSLNPGISKRAPGQSSEVTGDGVVNGWAVLAEKDNYDDVEMTNLPIDYINITQLRQVLLDSSWQEDHIREAREFDRESLRQSLGWLAENADQDDVVLLYVAAHGMYLKRVLNWSEFFAADWEQVLSHRRLLLIDSCQAANYTGVISSDPAPYLSIAAVDGDEYGWSGLEEEGLPIIGGVFTHYFTAAFSDSEADADGDGFVSAQEAALVTEEQQRAYMHEVVFAVPEFVEMYRGIGVFPDQDPTFPDVIVNDAIGEPLFLALEAYPSGETSTSPPAPTNTPTQESASQSPVKTAQVKVEEVSLATEDGVTLAGRLFSGGEGDVAVVLAHMGIADQNSWKPFAMTVAGRGFTALTFDFRCYGRSGCGKSGTSDPLHKIDVRTAIGFLRERGFSRIACMGASLGGTACMNAALDEELAGLVVIASPAPINIFKQYPDDLVSPSMPKLFVTTEKDRYGLGTGRISFMHERSPEPKALKIFPGTAHGTELFGTSYRGEFLELLVNFVEEIGEPVPTAQLEPAPSEAGELWTRPADEMVMVYVPAGEFEMGSDDEGIAYALQLCAKYNPEAAAARATCLAASIADEQRAHTVTLDGFWIDRTEVTNGQYRRCVEAGACTPPVDSGSYTRDTYYGDSTYDDYPVVWVGWGQATDYCAWAGARLPTEAEWEYAARGPKSRLFPWGNEFDDSTELAEVGTRLNYCDVNCTLGPNDETFDDGYADTAPVGSFPAGVSWCGALDMAGNVREWVAGWFGKYSSRQRVNPTGPPSGESRITRGGCWLDTPDDTRSANRGANTPDYTRHKVGFRCARDSETTSGSPAAQPAEGDSGAPAPDRPEEDGFSTYLLAQDISAAQLAALELDTLALEEKPILSVDDKEEDPRSDPRILQSLAQTGKLR